MYGFKDGKKKKKNFYVESDECVGGEYHKKITACSGSDNTKAAGWIWNMK